MARKVVHTAKAPMMVGDKAICMCGLSSNWHKDGEIPTCDGAHKLARQEEEDKIYEYNEQGEAQIVGELNR